MVDSARFHQLANRQIDNEFYGAHQYVATAVYFDARNMSYTAGVFYSHAEEERSHAKRFVEYLLDRSLPVKIGPVKQPVNDFRDPVEALRNAVERENEVTDEIFAMAQVARDDNDWFAQQTIEWFIKEQIEEENLFTTLLNVAESANGDWLAFETYVRHRGDD